jgi:hypothetical protein
MTSLRDRIVDLLVGSDDHSVGDLADRILAAVADHPEKAGGEGRADCPESVREFEKLGSEAFVYCGSPLKRWSQISREEQVAWMYGAKYWHDKLRAEQANHPDTVALRELREANATGINRAVAEGRLDSPGDRTRELIDSELKRVQRCLEEAHESQLIDDVCKALASLRRAVVMIDGERRRKRAPALDERGGQ